MSLLDEKLESHKEIGQLICQKMIAEMHKIGFSDDELTGVPQFDSAEFYLHKDPYTADENLTGSWFNGDRHRIGNIQFLSDGSFYAEYDVVKPHPTKQQWFVEAITAWGREELIKTEAKLLPFEQ